MTLTTFLVAMGVALVPTTASAAPVTDGCRTRS
jgi:hypothetical protein